MTFWQFVSKMTPQDGYELGAALGRDIAREIRRGSPRREVAPVEDEPEEPRARPSPGLVSAGSAFDSAGVGAGAAAAIAEGLTPEEHYARLAAAREEARRIAWAVDERARLTAASIVEKAFEDSDDVFFLARRVARGIMRDEPVELTLKQMAALRGE